MEVKSGKRDPHVAICDAAKIGRGIRLTAEEVAYLASDDAIAERATCVRIGETAARLTQEPAR